MNLGERFFPVRFVMLEFPVSSEAVSLEALMEERLQEAKESKEPNEPKELSEAETARPPRMKLSAEESLKRTKEFHRRREQFIAAIRKGKS